MFTPNVAKSGAWWGADSRREATRSGKSIMSKGEDLDLIGTSEITLVGQHTDEILNLAQFPLQYGGFSSCYRTEAGVMARMCAALFACTSFEK